MDDSKEGQKKDDNKEENKKVEDVEDDKNVVEEDFDTLISKFGPQNCFNLELAVEIQEKINDLSELEIRYAWATLQVYNKYI